MTYAKKTIILLLLSVAASLGAVGQDAHAKFTLPHEAMWGKTAMPAGAYSVSLEFGGITKAYVTSDDGGKVAFVTVPEITEVREGCEKTAVTLQRNGSNWSVRSMCFGELQLALYFPTVPVETAIAALPMHAEAVSGAR